MDRTRTPRFYTTEEAATKATQWRQRESAGAAEVTVATIWQWRTRGHLQGILHRGRRYIEHTELAAAERATRDRALRLVGISADRAP